MNKQEVMNIVGGFVAMGMDYDECLQDNGTGYDAEASACADKFTNMCEDGMSTYEAFVKAFFG